MKLAYSAASPYVRKVRVVMAEKKLSPKEAAIEFVKEFLGVVGEGECEVRQVYQG